MDIFNTQLEKAIFRNCEGIYLVDHQANTYQTLKTDPFLASIIQEKGSYTTFFKRIITARDAYNAHSKAFMSFIQQQSYGAIYSRRIQLVSHSETRMMTMIYYPVPDTETAYITLSSLPEKFSSRSMEATKQAALNENYLFTMLVSLDQDACFDAYVAEIAFSGQDCQTLQFSDWRNKIQNMIKPECRALFLSKTDPVYIRSQLSEYRRYYFDLQMQNMEGHFLWTRHSLIQVQSEAADTHLLFVYTVQDIDAEKKRSAYMSDPEVSDEAVQEYAGCAQSSSPEHMNEKEPRISALSTVILERIKNEIDEHYMEKLTLNQMARKYYMNTAYLGQLFIRKYDVSFHEYLTKRRMEEASVLLTATNHTIRQIIDMIGISNPQYFNRLFRKYYHCSPTEYRRRIHQ